MWHYPLIPQKALFVRVVIIQLLRLDLTWMSTLKRIWPIAAEAGLST